MHPIHQIHVPKSPSHPDEKDKNESRDEKKGSFHDKYLRLMAEFENYKRRSGMERIRLIEAADETLIKELIEVPENFERAFKLNERGNSFVEGMKLNNTKLITILIKHGLEVYGEPGDTFDPQLHEAIMCVHDKSIPDSRITEVFEHGYKLKGKIIKHAKVAVSN